MDTYTHDKHFAQQIYTMCTIFFLAVAALSINLYTQTPKIELIHYPVFGLIAMGELIILYLGISSGMDSWRLDHPLKKRVNTEESVCTGAKP